MTAKLRIKAKGIEIEWEGEVEYLKNDLPALISAIVAALGISAGDDDEQDEAEQAAVGTGKTFTTAALAAKVQPKSSSDLFKVALAKLQLSDKIEPASRAQILKEMKIASSFYKPSMSNNLGKIIAALLGSSEINEPKSGYFALTHAAQEVLRAKI